MNIRFTIWALILVAAILSVQCSTEKSEVPEIPSSIEQFFKPGSYSDGIGVLNYQECEFQFSRSGKLPLVLVLHGQYANGSDNKKQLDELIKKPIYSIDPEVLKKIESEYFDKKCATSKKMIEEAKTIKEKLEAAGATIEVK